MKMPISCELRTAVEPHHALGFYDAIIAKLSDKALFIFKSPNTISAGLFFSLAPNGVC